MTMRLRLHHSPRSAHAGCAAPVPRQQTQQACQAQEGASRTARAAAAQLRRAALRATACNILKLLNNLLGNGVTVAQQTLTLFVLVRIQVPQPALDSPMISMGCEIDVAENRNSP